MSGLPVFDPATEEVIGEAPIATAGDCLAAVDAAAGALGPWQRLAPRERAEILRRAFELLLAERDRLALLITRENGKVLAEALAEISGRSRR